MKPLVLLLAGALFVSSCTGGGSGKGGGKPRAGGVLRIGIERPRSLDPSQARTPEEILVADQLFDSLTSDDPSTLAVRDGVATVWTATPDQMHWDFTIRPGSRFSNGRPITSADVKYSLERVTRRGSTATTAFLLEPISGFAAFNDPKGTANELTGVTTPRPDLVHVDLDQPLSTLPALLGNATVGFYGFNLKSPKFADVRFREAIVAAVDRDAIVRGIYNGTVRATSRLVPEGVPGSQDDPCGDKCRHDPSKARALIKDAFGDN